MSHHKRALKKKKLQTIDTNTLSLASTISTSANIQIDSKAVSGTQVNPQDSTDRQSVVYQQNEQHFSDIYLPTPTNVSLPQNSPNNTIYPPTYDYSMPSRKFTTPSHVRLSNWQ